MNKEDLKAGEIYSCYHNAVSNKNKCIFLATKHNSSVKRVTYNKELYFKHSIFDYGLSNIQIATPEEKHWLNKCIELDKFITKEEAMKSFIPEYVKLNISQYGYERGDIAKIVENKNSGCILFVPNRVSTSFHKPNVYYSNSMFISSTKEEYEAQNKPKEIMQKVTTIIDKLTHTGNIDIPKGTTFEVIEEFENSYQVLKPTGYDIQGKYLFLHKCYFEPQEPEFVLSNQWCIKRDDKNWKIITDYLNNNYGRTYHQNNPNFPYVSNSRTNNNSKSTPHSNHQLITFEQFKKYVLKEEETKQPAKNAPIEEILEYCKKKYPIGTKFKVDYRPNLIYTVTGTLSKSSHMLNCIKDSKDSNPWIYLSGNYAEIVEESKEESSIKLAEKGHKLFSLDEITKVINTNYEKEDALEIIKTIKSIK